MLFKKYMTACLMKKIFKEKYLQSNFLKMKNYNKINSLGKLNSEIFIWKGNYRMQESI